MTFSWGFLPFPFYAYPKICIYNARVSSCVRTKFQSNSLSFLKFELESNSKADNYHYLKGKDYLKDKDIMAKAHCSP
jgi:hypothetical protein